VAGLASLEMMAPLTDEFDLGGACASRQARAGAFRCRARIEPLLLGSERYAAEPTDRGSAGIPVQLDVSRHAGRRNTRCASAFSAAVAGPCMRCLKHAAPIVEVAGARGGRAEHAAGGRTRSSTAPYVHDETLDLAGPGARDAFALAMPAKVLCREDCPGLCAGVARRTWPRSVPDHRHEARTRPALGEARRAAPAVAPAPGW